MFFNFIVFFKYACKVVELNVCLIFNTCTWWISSIVCMFFFLFLDIELKASISRAISKLWLINKKKTFSLDFSISYRTSVKENNYYEFCLNFQIQILWQVSRRRNRKSHLERRSVHMMLPTLRMMIHMLVHIISNTYLFNMNLRSF